MTSSFSVSDAWCESNAVRQDDPLPRDVWDEAWQAGQQASGTTELRHALLALDAGKGNLAELERALVDAQLPVAVAQRLSRRLLGGKAP